ncbi:cupin domain-containing protein [Spirosoma endbachense]|uniref:Cupin domain-containing protein n=1 Tax=Spirosoma endbachense TaxID=2666025 RepID=A0A6P1VKT4_9BACT|nr:cupin domain-containing protein [Spirosoma endbachense]QHV93663.1 cupin domain-containing protein [Spirosoma endbachense]
MKSILLFTIALCLYAPGNLLAQQHAHTTSTGNSEVSFAIIRQQILADKGLENREVKLLIVDFPPNSTSTAHRHPCPTFGYVLEGEIESVFEGKTYLYKKGDSFYEETNGLHSSARNNHPTAPAKLLVFFLAEKGKPTSVPEKK